MLYHIAAVLCVMHFATAALPPFDIRAEDNPAIAEPRARSLPPDTFDFENELLRRQGGSLPSGDGPQPRQGKRQFAPGQFTEIIDGRSLWFADIPTYYDVVQKQLLDCWLAAASIAVSWSGVDWTARLFYDLDGKPLAGRKDPVAQEVQVMLWDPATRLNHYFRANAYYQSNTEDRVGERWWNSAIMQGMMQLGSISDIGGIHSGNWSVDENGGNATAALAAMTGMRTVARSWEYYYGNEPLLMEEMAKAYYEYTPIVISTKTNTTVGNTFANNSTLHGNHAYAVLTTDVAPEGTNRLILRNPWGMTIASNASDVLENMIRVSYIEGFQRLNWGEKVGPGKVVSSTAPGPIPSLTIPHEAMKSGPQSILTVPKPSVTSGSSSGSISASSSGNTSKSTKSSASSSAATSHSSSGSGASIASSSPRRPSSTVPLGARAVVTGTLDRRTSRNE